MTEYYVLDWDAKPTIVGHVEDKNTPSLANKYTKGQALAPERRPVDLRISVEMGPDGGYPDYFTLQQIPIASERFVSSLHSVASNFEAYPALIREGERIVSGYFVINIIGRVSCLDTEGTKATFIDDENEIILRMKRLVIDPNKAMDLDLFRLHEFELLILVSGRVRAALQGLGGVSLLPAQGWSDGVWF